MGFTKKNLSLHWFYPIHFQNYQFEICFNTTVENTRPRLKKVFLAIWISIIKIKWLGIPTLVR